MQQTRNPFYEKRSSYFRIDICDGLTFPAHLHDEMEIIYCLKGCIRVTVMKQEKDVMPNECVLIFPEQIHSYHTEKDSQVLMMIFSPAAAETYGRTIQKYYPENPFLTGSQIPSDSRIAFRRLCQKIIQGNKNLCLAWTHVLLASLLPRLTLKERTDPEYMALTWRIIQYISEHFQESLTLERLAEDLHVNKYYLSHTFSQKLQMNFREYLNRIRLEYAMRLIRSTKQPLTDIWSEAGFESQRSFNRVFINVTGMSPKEYRKLE